MMQYFVMDIQQDRLELLQCSLGFKENHYLTPILTPSLNPYNIHYDFDLLHFQAALPELQHLQLFQLEGEIIQYPQQMLVVSQENRQQMGQKNQVYNPQLIQLIRMLVNEIGSSDQSLQTRARQLTKDSELFQVYKILHKKFKKLRKTKEEMTKYCMRKAFKYMSEKKKVGSKQSKNQSLILTSFFKKMTNEKTMNGNFLKKIFTQDGFIQNYANFLQQFKQLIKDDNQKKMTYLACLIQQCLQKNNFKKIEFIKRLPWTNQILNKTLQLSLQLTKYADPQYLCQSKKQI